AGVVAADLVAIGLDDRLLFGDRAAAVPGLCIALDRPLRGGIRTRSGGDGGLAERRGLLGGAARVVHLNGLLGGRELLLGTGGDLDLDVEDQPGELLPDRVHERLE